MNEEQYIRLTSAGAATHAAEAARSAARARAARHRSTMIKLAYVSSMSEVSSAESKRNRIGDKQDEKMK
jgi:hypothetical protein